MKAISAGWVLLDKNTYQILACHATGRRFDGLHLYDIPKGHVEPNENYLEAAKRELKEECGQKLLDLVNESDIIDLGLFNYLPEKDLYLFGAFVDFIKIKTEEMECNSYFTDKNGKQVKEMDKYLFVYDDNTIEFYKGLTPVLDEAIKIMKNKKSK